MQLLNELVELAKKAVNEEWKSDWNSVFCKDGHPIASVETSHPDIDEHNARFIAAANPAAILAIAEQFQAVIARAEKAEARADDLENKLRDRVESYDTLDGELTRAQDRVEILENHIADAGKMIIPESSRVTGWSERHRNVISVALLMFINCAYDRANYEAQEGDNEAVDKFLRDAKDAEFIRGEFMEAPHD